jgi:hypothetical protein
MKPRICLRAMKTPKPKYCVRARSRVKPKGGSLRATFYLKPPLLVRKTRERSPRGCGG